MKLVKVENSASIEEIQSEQKELVESLMAETGLPFKIINSIVTFADSTTNKKLKRATDIRRDKIFAVKSFFTLINKEPDKVKIADINDWQQWMLDTGNAKNYQGLEESTIYTRLSHLSAYFEWLKKLPEFARFIKVNPVRLAMPKPPKKYNSAKAKALTDEELSILKKYLEELARNDENKTAVRDYAIFRIFIVTGMRREEVIDLSGGDIKFTPDAVSIHALFKGGDYEFRTINDGETIAALQRYLQLTSRESTIGEKTRALWIRFDNGAQSAYAGYRIASAEYDQSQNKTNLKKPVEPRMSSDSFNKNIKKYAKAAGIGHFHIHQFRHTFARMVAEDSGLIETQDALGHKNIETTKQYVDRIQFKKDKHSQRIIARLEKVNELAAQSSVEAESETISQ